MTEKPTLCPKREIVVESLRRLERDTSIYKAHRDFKPLRVRVEENRIERIK